MPPLTDAVLSDTSEMKEYIFGSGPTTKVFPTPPPGNNGDFPLLTFVRKLKMLFVCGTREGGNS